MLIPGASYRDGVPRTNVLSKKKMKISTFFGLPLALSLTDQSVDGAKLEKTTWRTRKQNLACLTCATFGSRTHLAVIFVYCMGKFS